MLSSEDQTKLAKQAYYAYGGVTDFKNYQGLPMPEWDNLTDTIREAWKAAARYCFNDGFQAGQEFEQNQGDEPDHR